MLAWQKKKGISEEETEKMEEEGLLLLHTFYLFAAEK